MPLSPEQTDLVNKHLTDTEAMSTIILGFCWNDSALADAANVNIREAETIEDAARRLDLGWNPAWLTEAGYTAYDATGVAIEKVLPPQDLSYALPRCDRLVWMTEFRTQLRATDFGGGQVQKSLFFPSGREPQKASVLKSKGLSA